MDKPIPSHLDRVIEEMRTIGMVAGQCSVDDPDNERASMAAAESDRCLRWADALSAIRDALAAAQQEQEALREAADLQRSEAMKVAAENARLREALVAAEQFIWPEIPRGPSSNGWQATIELVRAALSSVEGPK